VSYQSPAVTCKTCGSAQIWIPVYRRYYCYVCNTYPPICPRCFFDLSWIAQYKRYYCYRCHRYLYLIDAGVQVATVIALLEASLKGTFTRILNSIHIGALGELAKIRITPKMLLRLIFLIAVSIIFVSPIYYLISISFSSRFFGGTWIALVTGDLGKGIINQIIICCLCVVFSILVGFPAAYTFSRYRFIADKHIFFWFLLNRMTPPACFILPYLIMFRALGIFDTVYAVVLAYSIFNVPIAVWLLTSFMSSIPREIDETAFTDGYSLSKFFWKIFLPLCRPGITVTGFFIWLFSWSEAFIASIITSIDAKPLSAQMLVFAHGAGANGLAAAASVFTLIPGLILIYWARTFIAKGFTYGRL